jgi:hypothetical protein
LAGDWTAVAEDAVGDLRRQASAWVAAELETLDHLLGKSAQDSTRFREAMRQL